MAGTVPRMLCLLLIISIAMACAPAMADSAEGTKVYAYAYTLKIYDEPSKKSDVIELVPFARSLTKLAEKRDWAMVATPEGRTGYCSFKQLTEKDPNTYDVTVYAQQDRAPVYERPSVDAPMIGHLNRNDKATMLAMTPTGDWLRVKYGSHDGYIQRPRVDYHKYNKGKLAWVNANDVRVYYDPEIDESFGTLSKGQKLQVMSVENGWAKIRSGSGLIAYCKAEYLSMKKVD